MKATAVLVRRSTPELEALADILSKRLGMTRTVAFAAMDKGALPKTIAAVELRLVRHLLGHAQ